MTKIFKTAHAELDKGVQYLRSKNRLDEEELEAIHSTLYRFEAAINEPEFNVYGVASLLGLDAVKCQSIIDEVINDRFPLLAAAYYSAKPKISAEKDFPQAEMDRYEGTYLLWMKQSKILSSEPSKSDGQMWLQCALGIRYLQELGSGRYMRCKLHVPAVDGAHVGSKVWDTNAGQVRYWEYDGFPVIRESRIFWVFEKRQMQRSDCIFFITDTDKRINPQHMAMRGSYLTTAHDSGQSIVSGDLLMQRVLSHGYGGTQLSYRDLMLNSLKVRSAEDSSMIVPQWERARDADRDREDWESAAD